MIPSASSPLQSPSHVGSCAMSAVHCVSARTKTRSKNSSSGMTRPPVRSVADRRGVRDAWLAGHGAAGQAMPSARRSSDITPSLPTQISSVCTR